MKEILKNGSFLLSNWRDSRQITERIVAIYGRRRVGKTYLVDETFAGRITFRHAGLSPADEDSKGLLKLQLNHFYNSLELQGMEKCDKPTNWLDAFLILEKFLQSRDDGSRQVVFLDELPWLDTPKSGFIRAFEAFWNTWAQEFNGYCMRKCKFMDTRQIIKQSWGIVQSCYV